MGRKWNPDACLYKGKKEWVQKWEIQFDWRLQKTPDFRKFPFHFSSLHFRYTNFVCIINCIQNYPTMRELPDRVTEQIPRSTISRWNLGMLCPFTPGNVNPENIHWTWKCTFLYKKLCIVICVFNIVGWLPNQICIPIFRVEGQTNTIFSFEFPTPSLCVPCKSGGGNARF